MDSALHQVKFGHVLGLMDSHPFGKVCWLGGFLQTCMNPHETLSQFFPQLFKGHHKWAMPNFMYPIHGYFSTFSSRWIGNRSKRNEPNLDKGKIKQRILKKKFKVDLKLVKFHYQKHHHSSHENKLCPCKGRKEEAL